MQGRCAAVVPAHYVQPAVVVEHVAHHLGLTTSELRSRPVTSALNYARQIAALLLLDHSMLSQVEIGRALGRVASTAGRDLLIAARARLRDEPNFAALVSLLGSSLREAA